MTTDSALKINPQRVEDIFLGCLFLDGEDRKEFVPAEGITCNVAFHPGRLAGHKEEISAMLEDLPDDFKKTGGGGMSFLSAGQDRHGNPWTDLHQRMEQLMQLGVGIGKVECLLPRSMWDALPGGVPYFCIN